MADDSNDNVIWRWPHLNTNLHLSANNISRHDDNDMQVEHIHFIRDILAGSQRESRSSIVSAQRQSVSNDYVDYRIDLPPAGDQMSSNACVAFSLAAMK